MVSAKTHWLATEKEIPFARLAEQYFIGLEGGALQDHLDTQAARLGVVLRYRIRLRTFESICAAASNGVGVAIVPDTVARQCKRAYNFGITPLTDAWARRNLSVCVASGFDPTPIARELFDHLANA